MKWIKYRYKWSSGPGHWSWRETSANTEDQCEEDISSLKADTITDSEHYRGIEWNLVDRAPRRIILNRIRGYSQLSASYAKLAMEMTDHLLLGLDAPEADA